MYYSKMGRYHSPIVNLDPVEGDLETIILVLGKHMSVLLNQTLPPVTLSRTPLTSCAWLGCACRFKAIELLPKSGVL